MKPIVLFSIQFTLSLAAYALIALWYIVPRLSRKPREAAVTPLLWVHAFRMIGGTVLAPGAVGIGVPLLFQRMIGYGDLITALLALIALVALRALVRGHSAGLAGRHRRDVGHRQRDHPVDARQRVHAPAGRELGHRDDLCAGPDREQRADPMAANQVTRRRDRRGRDQRGRNRWARDSRVTVVRRQRGCLLERHHPGRPAHPAMPAAIWHNNKTAQPFTRSLIAYDH